MISLELGWPKRPTRVPRAWTAGLLAGLGAALFAVSALLLKTGAVSWDASLFRVLNEVSAAPASVLTPLSHLFLPVGVIAVVTLTVIYVVARNRSVLPAAGGAGAAASAWVLSHVAKAIADRPRPYEVVADAVLRQQPARGTSFPSTHTAVTLAVVIALVPFLPQALAAVAIAYAVLMGWSRVYLGVHYPLDVLGGAGIGIAVGGVTFLALWVLLHRAGRSATAGMPPGRVPQGRPRSPNVGHNNSAIAHKAPPGSAGTWKHSKASDRNAGANLETRPAPGTGSAESDPSSGPVRPRVSGAASRAESPAMEGTRSLEVRWIFPGQMEAMLAEWFDRFPAAAELQEDNYLLDPHLPGLSVKVRSGRTFEVKTYRGSRGILDAAGRARGRMQSWQKWSFPVAPPSNASECPPGWRLMHKKRRISQFLMADERIKAVPTGRGEEPRCGVELTEIRLSGAAWWTLGFETIGPTSALQSHLEATAALVFAQDLPEGIELGMENSMSYMEWLRPRSGRTARGSK